VSRGSQAGGVRIVTTDGPRHEHARNADDAAGDHPGPPEREMPNTARTSSVRPAPARRSRKHPPGNGRERQEHSLLSEYGLRPAGTHLDRYSGPVPRL